jgi:hypothetical protein
VRLSDVHRQNNINTAEAEMRVLIGSDFANAQGRRSYRTKHFPIYHFLQIVGDESYFLRLRTGAVGVVPCADLYVLFTQGLCEKEQTVEAKGLSCLEIVESRGDLVNCYHHPHVDNMGREQATRTHIIEQ